MLLDVSKISDFQKDIEEIGFESFGSSTRSFLKDIISQKESSSYLVFTDLRNDIVTGFLILSVAADEAEIIQIAVRKDLCQKGIGSEIMSEMIRYCISKGISKIFLEVRVSNNSAVKMYEKHGFQKIGDRKSYYKDPVEDALIMSKRCCRDCV